MTPIGLTALVLLAADPTPVVVQFGKLSAEVPASWPDPSTKTGRLTAYRSLPTP